MQLTSRSAGAGARTGTRQAPARAARPARAVRFHTEISPTPPSRSAHTAARAEPPAPSTSALIPRNSRPSAAISPGASVFSAAIAPSGANVSVFAAPIATGCSARLARQSERRTLVGDRDVGAGEAGRSPARGSSRRGAPVEPAGAGSASHPCRARPAPRCGSRASGCGRPASRARPGALPKLECLPSQAIHLRLHVGGCPPFFFTVA